MNIIDRALGTTIDMLQGVQERFDAPSARDIERRGGLDVENNWNRPREERRRRVERSVFGGGGLDGDDVEDRVGSTIDRIEQFKEIIGYCDPEKIIGRNEALEYSVYHRAVIQSAEAAASLICEAIPEERTRINSYRSESKDGWSGYQNRYSFWRRAFINLNIDGVFYGEIGGTRPSRVITPHPQSCVEPAMVGDKLEFLVLERIENVMGRDRKKNKRLEDKNMLHITRPNVKTFYQNIGNGPVYSDRFVPMPTYHALSHVIRQGLVIDLLERFFWESDGSLKFGHVITMENESESDFEYLKELKAMNKVMVPFKIEGTTVTVTPITAFPDYDKTLHMIKDDCEARIASFFGVSPSDLGSDAARTGTGAAELSQANFRHGVLPIVNSAKYEIERKLLDGTALNVPNLRYFMSTGDLAKLAQSMAGIATLDEVRKNLFDLPPRGEDMGGDEIYMGAQGSMGGDSESNNSDGENM